MKGENIMEGELSLTTLRMIWLVSGIICGVLFCIVMLWGSKNDGKVWRIIKMIIWIIIWTLITALPWIF